MNENKKKQLGEILLNRMGVTQYEEWLKSQGMPPKGDGPKIVSAAFKLYGPPLSRTQLSNAERRAQEQRIIKLGVNVEYTMNLLRGIIEEFAARNKLSNGDFENTKLKMTMFNAVIRNSSNVDLIENVFRKIKPPFLKKTYTNGYTLELISVTARGGRFKKIIEFSKEYFVTENIQKNITSIDFKVRISKEGGGRTQGASVTIYSTGVIRMSGGYLDVVLGEKNGSNAKLQALIEQPETIRKFIVDNYTDKELFKSKRFEFNNIAGVFKINKKIVIEKTVDNLGGLSKNVFFEPELSPPLLKLNLDGFTLRASVAGVVQLKGIKKPDDVLKNFKTALDKIKSDFVLGAKLKNFNKNNYSLSKMAKRVNDKPAPNVARRGTTCPIGRRPTPYSFQGKCPGIAGKFFVKPNPQGQPCCYKVPKKIGYSKNQVKNLYNKANVKVPQNVKNRFKVGNEGNNKGNNVGVGAANITVVMDPEVGLKINSRQCSRYTRVALVDITKRLGILSVNPKASKDELCRAIQSKAQNLGMNKTKEAAGNLAVTVNGKTIFGEGRNLKLGRRRCATYDKQDLLDMARKIRLTTVDNTMSKTKICEEFEKFAETTRQRKQNTIVRVRRERIERIQKRVENENRRKIEQKEQVEKERNNSAIERVGLTKAAIRKELPGMYGKQFMKKYGKLMEPYVEPQVNLMFNTLKQAKFNLGARGFPLKPNVDKFKKNVVIAWKNVLEPEFIRLSVFSSNNAARDNLRKLIGKNKEITQEILNSYKKSIRSAAIEKNNNGKFADKNKIKKAKKAWLYVQKTYGLLKSPSPQRRRLMSPRSGNTEEI